MKKFLLSALCAVAALAGNAAEYTYSVQLTAKADLPEGGATLGGVAWTYPSGAVNYDGNRGVQLFSKGGTIDSWTISTDAFAAATVSEVEFTASTTSKGSLDLSVKVGDTNFTSDNSVCTATAATAFTFTGSAQGTVAITIAKSMNGESVVASGAYLGSITITYTADAEIGGDDPVVPPTPAETEGKGTAESPYTVADLAKLNNPGTTAWVTGVIVGCYNYDQTTSQNVFSSTELTTNSNIVIATSASSTDYVAIQIKQADVRAALNLVDNPGNMGKTVSVQGTLEGYISDYGVKAATAYTLDGETPTPPTPVETTGDGTEANPYTVADVIALNNSVATGWVKGYIVGSSNGGATLELTAADAVQSASNLLIADKADETDLAKIVPVQLKSGTDIRAALNLVDNPGNLGKELAVTGSLELYFKQPGVKSPTAYKLDGQGGGTVTPDPGAPTEGPGSEAQPLTITEAVAKNNDGSINWVTGVIVGVYDFVEDEGNVFDGEAPFTTNSNIVLASTADGTDYFSVQLPAGKLREDLNMVDRPTLMGREVSVCGKLTKYCGVNGVKETSSYSIVGGLPEIPVKETESLTTFVEEQDTENFYKIKGAVTVFYQSPDKKYTFITDGTSNLEVYGALDNTYTNGDVLTGIIGKYGYYQNMPQMTPQADSFGEATKGEAIVPAVKALADVQIAEYVTLSNVNIVEVPAAEEGKASTWNVVAGEATRQLFDRFAIKNIKAAEGVKIVGIGSIHGKDLQIFPVEIDYDNSAISEISAAANGQTVVYDLQGRRLAAPVKGINIINGKKVLVK